jgi:CheY-like chemotaxis protein
MAAPSDSVLDPARQSRTSDRTVLLVDDNETTLRDFGLSLRSEGFSVHTASNAQAALREVAAASPDAIIMDFHMPALDGLELLRRIRACETTRRARVVIVTGDYFLEDELMAELNSLGAAVHYKPLWVEDLTALVHGLLDPAAPQ